MKQEILNKMYEITMKNNEDIIPYYREQDKVTQKQMLEIAYKVIPAEISAAIGMTFIENHKDYDDPMKLASAIYYLDRDDVIKLSFLIVRNKFILDLLVAGKE